MGVSIVGAGVSPYVSRTGNIYFTTSSALTYSMGVSIVGAGVYSYSAVGAYSVAEAYSYSAASIGVSYYG